MAKAGDPAHGLVETVDVHPTLVDLCGLAKSEELAGASLRPLLTESNHPGKDGALSNYTLNGYRGSALRTDRWRLVEWAIRRLAKSLRWKPSSHLRTPLASTTFAPWPSESAVRMA